MALLLLLLRYPRNTAHSKFRVTLVPKNTLFTMRKHPNLRGKMSVFSLISQRIESVGMLVGPGQPLICLAS